MGAMMERERVTMLVQFVCHPQKSSDIADQIRSTLMMAVEETLDANDAVAVVTRTEEVR